MNNQNIIKNACATLEVTVPELAELIGASEGTVRNWTSANEVPVWASKSIAAHTELREAREIKEMLQKLFAFAKHTTAMEATQEEVETPSITVTEAMK